MAEEIKKSSSYDDRIIPAPPAPSPLNAEECWHDLEERIRTGNNSIDLDRVRSAYEYAAAAHADQKRRDGSPYVTHCIATA